MNLRLSHQHAFPYDPSDHKSVVFMTHRFKFAAVSFSQSVFGPLVALNTILTDA